MARVHRLQHIERFFTTALTEDDPVGPHTQRVLHQFALTNFAFALDAGWARFHSADMWLLQLQVRRRLRW